MIFKLIRKTISLIILIIILLVAIAIWKGGEGFRWIGKKTEQIGRSVERFGDKVDEIRSNKQKAEKTIKQLKEKIKGED